MDPRLLADAESINLPPEVQIHDFVKAIGNVPDRLCLVKTPHKSWVECLEPESIVFGVSYGLAVEFYRSKWFMGEDGQIEFGEAQKVTRQVVFEAVEDPTPDQRKDLPAAAFAAPFGSGDAFERSKSKLPHHVRTVTNPNDDQTVDLPRLRNALARFGQTDFGTFPDPTKMRERARRHLDSHAKRLLKGRDEDMFPIGDGVEATRIAAVKVLPAAIKSMNESAIQRMIVDLAWRNPTPFDEARALLVEMSGNEYAESESVSNLALAISEVARGYADTVRESAIQNGWPEPVFASGSD